MKRALVLSVAVVAGLGVTACGYLGDDPDPYRPPVYYGPPEAAAGAIPGEPGQHLYLRDCSHCHGNDGRGTERGPDLTVGTNGPALTDFVLRTGRMPVEARVQQMRAGEPVYDEGQIAAIVAYMTREFRPPGPDIPDADPARGDLGEGQQVYQEHCASCHATTGIGGAMLIHPRDDEPKRTRGIVIPGLEDSDPREVAASVRSGPGSMPVFGTRAINDHQLDSLLRYMEYLRDPADPGGAPIGRVGPVVEGAIGWALGLGLLMVIARWIGTKAGEHP
jgi:ubiquinol-cytochrome c reductase cytochrome c subunit